MSVEQIGAWSLLIVGAIGAVAAAVVSIINGVRGAKEREGLKAQLVEVHMLTNSTLSAAQSEIVALKETVRLLAEKLNSLGR